MKDFKKLAQDVVAFDKMGYHELAAYIAEGGYILWAKRVSQ